MALVAMLLNVVLVIALFAWAAWVAPSRYHTDDNFRKSIDFLVYKWHPAMWWYSLVLLFRGVLLASVTTLVPDSQFLQNALMLLTLVGSLAVHLCREPYSDQWANRLEVTELISLIGIVTVGAGLIDDLNFESLDGVMAKQIATLMLIFIGLASLALFLAFVYGMYAASFPAQVRSRHDEQVKKLTGQMKAAAVILAHADEDDLSDFLHRSSYLDRHAIMGVVNLVGLEFCGIRSKLLTEQRLRLSLSVQQINNMRRTLGLQTIAATIAAEEHAGGVRSNLSQGMEKVRTHIERAPRREVPENDAGDCEHTQIDSNEDQLSNVSL